MEQPAPPAVPTPSTQPTNNVSQQQQAQPPSAPSAAAAPSSSRDLPSSVPIPMSGSSSSGSAPVPASMDRFLAMNASLASSLSYSPQKPELKAVPEPSRDLDDVLGSAAGGRYKGFDEESNESESSSEDGFDSDDMSDLSVEETQPKKKKAAATVHKMRDDDEWSEEPEPKDDSDYLDEEEPVEDEEFEIEEEDSDYDPAPKKRKKKPKKPSKAKAKAKAKPKPASKRRISDDEDDYEDEDLDEDELVMDTGSEADDDGDEDEDEDETMEEVEVEPVEKLVAVEPSKEESEEEPEEDRGPLYSREDVPIGDVVEFACVVSFFRMFQDVLNLRPYSPQEIESAIRHSKKDPIFEEIVSRLLFLMLNRKEGFRPGGWKSTLSRILKERKAEFVGFADAHHDDRETYAYLIEEQETPEYHPLKTVTNDIHAMSSYAKVLILSNLCDWCACESQDIVAFAKRQRSDDIRAVPLGRNKEGSVYWYFAERSDVTSCRIFRQDVNEAEGTVSWNIATDSVPEMEAFCEAAPSKHEDRAMHTMCVAIREELLPVERDRAKGEFRKQQRLERQARGLGINERNIIDMAAPLPRRRAAAKVRYTFSDEDDNDEEEYVAGKNMDDDDDDDDDDDEFEDEVRPDRRSRRTAAGGSRRSGRSGRSRPASYYVDY